jgi:competence protein ComEC
VRCGLRIDPVLVIASSLVGGAAATVAPAATVAATALGLALVARYVGVVAVALAAACALASGWRASEQLAEHARRQNAARQLLPSPSRCAANGRVSSSPTRVGGALRFDAELSLLDCQGVLDQNTWPARLYLPIRSPPGTAPSGADAGTAAALTELTPPLLSRGDQIAIVADLGLVSEFRNFDLPDPRPGAARRGSVFSGAVLSLEIERPGWALSGVIDRARAHVRRRILATFAAPVAGMARALVLGENDLPPEEERAFQRSGLSHLLAVSGTHLIVAVLALVRALEALLERCPALSARHDVRRLAALLGLCLGPIYADFAGGSGSAWRAAWMLGAVLGVRALGRHVFPSRALAASLVAGWLDDALVAFDTSFSLSIAATAGLLLFGGRLRETALRQGNRLTRPRAASLGRLARALGDAALTTLAATLPCLPILLSMSSGINLASVAANLLAAPLGEAVALPLCLAHALCFPFPALERGVALVASGALALIRGVAFASASVDWLHVELPPPSAWHLTCFTTGAAAWLASAGRPWLSAAAAAAALTASPLRAPRAAARRALPPLGWRTAAAIAVAWVAIEVATRWPHSAWWGRACERLRVTALDVGQGDATLVDLPDGRLMLIDGGGFVGTPIDPGERVIVPVLRARRRSRVDVVVLTHPHPDHYGGLTAVVREMDVGEFWYGGGDEALGAPRGTSEQLPSAYRELLAVLRERRVSLVTARELCARVIEAGPAAIRVLHPCPDLADERGANDNSLVIHILHGRRAALFAGDAERWAEQQLVAHHAGELRADFLKVGHHGSRTSSSPAFLASVRPSFASISSGVRNRFGHPHAAALANLDRAGARVARLDRQGSAEWQSDGGEKQGVRTFIDGLPDVRP